MNLCTFSRSELMENQILDECPIGLANAEEGRHCLCRLRVRNVPVVGSRVIQCKFPKLWNSQVIRSPEAFAEYQRQRCAAKVQAEREAAKQHKGVTVE